MNRNSLLVFLMILFALPACEGEKDTYFVISSDQVGLIKRHSSIDQVEGLYATDSVIKDTLRLSIGVGNGKLKIFDKQNKHLLTLTPGADSVQRIEHVLIADPRFNTIEGIGLHSNFGEIKKHYTIDKIITSLNNVVVILKESDIYFTIDKKELPAHLRYTKTRQIELVEIPDQAKIKYLMVGWD